jgi:hypothetical protein
LFYFLISNIIILPTNSNIINIVLHTTNLYDTPNGKPNAPYVNLRNYCGKILAELFNTNLILAHDVNVFYN